MRNHERMLIEFIRENFENMRHAEAERRWFMHIYVLAIVGALVGIAQAQSAIGLLFWCFFSGFLFVLSAVGLLLTIRWNANINADIAHNDYAVHKMPENFKIPEEIQRVVSFGETEGYKAKISLRWISVRLYEVMLLASLGGFGVSVYRLLN